MATGMPRWVEELLPILGLVLVVALVVWRLPHPDVGHPPGLRKRRFWNWLPAGLTYAFLYMGRYNLNAAKNALGDAMTKSDFGVIFFWGTLVYGVSFILNGPLADRYGGRKALLVAAVGSAVANGAMGALLASGAAGKLLVPFSVLYAINMYFQSFGAVAIVKVNSAWFHVRERGTFGGVFGVLISLGIYFAYDWGRLIAENLPLSAVFFVPASILVVFVVWDFFAVWDYPSEAGFADFDPGDAKIGADGEVLGVWEVAKRMLRNPVILTICAVEFCSGFLRNAIQQWYTIFAKETGISTDFVAAHWGMLLCSAGILGGMSAGLISDRLFGSRRGPVATVLYGALVAGTVIAFLALGTPLLGWIMVAMALAYIGVHGMLSGTASMDFGGKRNAGLAVGIIDGFVYLGTAAQAVVLGNILPTGAAAKDPSAWWLWPAAMLPAALIGLGLATRLWNARPQRGGVAH